MPHNWKIKRINELGDIVTGTTPSTLNEEFFNGDYLWASPGDFEKGKYIKQTNATLTKKGINITRKIPKNSVLVVCIGSVGKIGMAYQEMTTNQQINSIICKYDEPDFIYYNLLTNKHIIKNKASQVVVPILNKTEFGKIKLFIPEEQNEQKQIASILSGVDALIESTQKVIEKTEGLKKGLMQKLFTQGIDKTSIILSRLDSIIFLQRGHDLPNHKRRIGKIPVIGSNGIVGYHNESKSNGPGVLIGRSGTLGKVYYAEEDYWPLNTSLYVKEFYSSFPKFVFYLLQNLDYEKFNAGTSVPTLNRNYLHPFKLKIPININEQQKIASILSGVDAYIQKNQQYKERLEKLKKGLMQKLLTGQIRVKV